MVKNIDLEAPKSPHHNFLFLLLNFFTSRRFRNSNCFKYLISSACKKIPRQVMPRYICNYLCDISHLRRRFWLMQVYKPYSCVLRRK